MTDTHTAATAELSVSARSNDDGEDAVQRGAWGRLRRMPLFWISASVIVIMIVMAIVPSAFAGWFGHGNPRNCNLSNSGHPPSAGHPFGFDIQGCDLYANVIYGARDSISIGLLVTALTLAIAVVLGSAAGYYGRLVDVAVSRVSDVVFGFPFILGALVVLTTIRVRGVLSVSLVLALFGWPPLTRLMRGSVLAVKESDYVLAARSLGARDVWIVRKHIIPNSIGPVLIIGAITVGGVIAAEATLTYLGVGLQEPAISWGLELASAQQNFQTHPLLLVFPGVFLSATVLSFIALGECLQDALDPRRSED